MSDFSFRMWKQENDEILAEMETCIKAIEKDGFTVTWSRKVANRLQEKGYKIRYLILQAAWEVSK